MTLKETQNIFVVLIAKLITFAYENGYTLSLGDAWARDGHKEHSLHYVRLALDLNLFKDGKYLRDTEDHKPLGEYWESLHSNCRWGGNFKKIVRGKEIPASDGNHYEMFTSREG